MNIRGRAPRIGILGFGRISERVHLPVLLELGVVPTVIADPSLERKRLAAQLSPGSHVVNGLREALAHDLDGVVIATPNYVHAEDAVTALNARVAVLCEKPLALSTSELQAVLTAAQECHQPLVAGYPSSHRADVMALLQTCASGKIGKIEHLSLTWLRDGGVPDGWFLDRHRSGGGALLDLGSHLIHLAFLALGTTAVKDFVYFPGDVRTNKTESTWYNSSSQVAACDVERSGRVLVETLHGATMFIDVDWDCATPRDGVAIDIRGSNGSLELRTLFGLSPRGDRPQYPLSIQVRGESSVNAMRCNIDPLDGYRTQLRYFLDQIGSGFSQTDPHLIAALSTVGLIESIYSNAQ